MKLSLDEDSNLVYTLGLLSTTKDVCIPLNLLLESEKDTREEKVSLFEYIPLYKEFENSYNYYEIDDIPILEVNSLSRISPDDDSIETFIKDSNKMKNKDKIIIDLRGNKGGNMVNIEEWYKGFTGEKLRLDMIQVDLYTETSVTLAKNKFKTKENEKENIKSDCIEAISQYESKDFFPGWSPIKYERYKEVENDVKVYILIDENTASAAEFLAYYLRRLDNVILVGTNTNGCILTGNCNLAYLTNSKIPVHVPYKIYLNTDFTNIDGLGLLPDLWVKPEQALDRIVKFIKKN